MARFKVASAAAAGMTTVDLSAGTEGNTGMKGAGTSLGGTSTLQVAATHGLPDAGLDAYFNLTQIDAKPSGKHLLHVKLTVGTKPTESSNGNVFLHALVAPSAALSGTNGYYAGFMRTSGGLDRIGSANRVGTSPGGGTPNFATEDFIADFFIQFDGTTATHCTGYATDSANAENFGNTANDAGGTFTNVFVGVMLSQANASPSSVVTWAGVTLQYAWV